MNPRITKKERGLLKGAIRRVFSRSDLRRKVLDAAEIAHSDPSRPRVKKWVRCVDCKQPTPKYLAQVDHRDPVVPLDTALEHMNWDTVVNRVWCEENNLAVCCATCHAGKSRVEMKERRKNKKESKK